MPPLPIPAPAAACPTIPSGARRRRTAGGSNSARRWRLPACRRGPRSTARASTPRRSDIGDAILARKDAPASYHLSCVVDDAASGVTTVVRGADLRPSTPIQRLLQQLLGLPEPTYLHHPLVAHARRPPPRQARPRADACRDARRRHRRAGARRRAARRQASAWFRRSSTIKAPPCAPLLLVLLLLAMARRRLCPRARRDRRWRRART